MQHMQQRLYVLEPRNAAVWSLEVVVFGNSCVTSNGVDAKRVHNALPCYEIARLSYEVASARATRLVIGFTILVCLVHYQ